MEQRFSFFRVHALVMRYIYLLASSWPRVADLIYWPLVQMLTWGFLQTYLARLPPQSGFVGKATIAAGTLIGAMLLWDILFRGQLGFSISFLEEMWSRNVGNLMMSPLRPMEFVTALMVMSLLRLAIGIIPVTFLAIWFFGFNLWGLGIGLAAFFVNLILTSWSIGLVVSGLLLRNGMGAEGLVWTILFLMLPLTCVYYPVATLPAWLQPLAWALPPTYVFEGFRAILVDHTFRYDLMLMSFSLNMVYFISSVFVFLCLLQSARKVGSLLQMGE